MEEKSVLDAVLTEATRIRASISSTDQQKLDEYLNSVREVEVRINRAGAEKELQGWRPTLAKPNVSRPPDGMPQDIGAHMRLMCDILVLAFQTDTTRVCTLKLNNDHSYLQFPHLQVNVGHHELSHRNNDDWLRVNQFFVEQVAYIAQKLDEIKEGERTALDNSILLFCSSMLAGATHNAAELPVVVLGRGGGRVDTGRVLDYRGKSDRQMCRLYLSLMDKAGIRMERFGDANERLPEI